MTYQEPGTSVLPCGSPCWDPFQFAQLDFGLCPERWKNVVEDVASDPFANVHSDHFPLLAKAKLSLGARKAVARKPCWDFQRATEETINSLNQSVGTQLANTC